jgi:putative SOS response-associated peptidase YedK
MCYSAMVEQNVKKLGFRYKARIDQGLFDDLFTRRLDGEAIKFPLALDAFFIKEAETPGEKEIKKLAEEYQKRQISEIETDIFKQKKRLADAERKLAVKPVKSTENDKRIATNKINLGLKKIEKLQKLKLDDSDSRIYPKMYSPLILQEGSQRVLRLARYHLRPSSETEEFDKTHDGCYNARQDSLLKVAFWRDVLGENHGIWPIKKFFENVHKTVHGKPQNAVLCFEPREGGEIVVPALYDHWKQGQRELDSFAIITSDPNPEVKAAGHDRTPIALKEDKIDTWLNTKAMEKKQWIEFLSDKRLFYFEHSLVA